MMSTEAGPAETRIYELAARHGIVAERLRIDDWADNVTELSGDEVVHDPVEDLVVTMRRKGIITDQEATELFGDYLEGKADETEPSGRNRPIRERLAKSLSMAREVGPLTPLDHKKVTDELWGEED